MGTPSAPPHVDLEPLRTDPRDRRPGRRGRGHRNAMLRIDDHVPGPSAVRLEAPLHPVGHAHLPRHRDVYRAREHLVAGSELRNAAIQQHRDAIGQQHRAPQIVGDHRHRRLRLGDGAAQVEAQGLLTRRVQIVEGLVEQPHGGPQREGARQRETTQLAAGEAARIARGEMRDVEVSERLRHARAPCIVAEPGAAQCDVHVVIHPAREGDGALEDQGDQAVGVTLDPAPSPALRARPGCAARCSCRRRWGRARRARCHPPGRANPPPGGRPRRAHDARRRASGPTGPRRSRASHSAARR